MDYYNIISQYALIGFSNINVMDLEVRISRPDLFIPEVVKLTNDAYDGLLSGSLNPESFKKGYADIKRYIHTKYLQYLQLMT